MLRFSISYRKPTTTNSGALVRVSDGSPPAIHIVAVTRVYLSVAFSDRSAWVEGVSSTATLRLRMLDCILSSKARLELGQGTFYTWDSTRSARPGEYAETLSLNLGACVRWHGLSGY